VTLANERTATTSAPAVPDDVVLSVDTPAATWLDNKAFGCFQNGTGGNYVFFYVMADGEGTRRQTGQPRSERAPGD
jgi:hypothetical protein